MKKIFLLTAILFFQLTIVFGQSNNWGPWNTSGCYPRIQFRSKLVSKQYYNGGSVSADGCNSGQGYQWKVQVKNNYTKTVWVNFAGGNKVCIEKNYGGGAGLMLDPGEIGEIPLKDWYANATDGIFVLIKSMAFLSSKKDDSYKNDPALQYERCTDGGLCQVCRINISAPHCPEVKISDKVNMNDNGTSSDHKIKERIAEIFKNSLNGNTYQYGKLKSKYTLTKFTYNDETINFTQHEEENYYSDISSMDIDYIIPFSKLSLMQKDEVNNSSQNTKGLVFPYDSDIKVNRHQRIFTKGYYSSEYNTQNFIFHFNTDNYQELVDAIKALKNPNKNYNASSNQNAGVQNSQANKPQKTVEQKQELSNEKLNEEITSNYNLGSKAFKEGKYKEAEGYFQKILLLSPEEKTSYSNLISIKLELDRAVIEEANKNSSNPTIYNKQVQIRIVLLKEVKLLLEKYISLDNTNQEFINYLVTVNQFLKDNNSQKSTPSTSKSQQTTNNKYTPKAIKVFLIEIETLVKNKDIEKIKAKFRLLGYKYLKSEKANESIYLNFDKVFFKYYPNDNTVFCLEFNDKSEFDKFANQLPSSKYILKTEGGQLKFCFYNE